MEIDRTAFSNSARSFEEVSLRSKFHPSNSETQTPSKVPLASPLSRCLLRTASCLASGFPGLPRSSGIANRSRLCNFSFAYLLCFPARRCLQFALPQNRASFSTLLSLSAACRWPCLSERRARPYPSFALSRSVIVYGRTTPHLLIYAASYVFVSDSSCLRTHSSVFGGFPTTVVADYPALPPSPSMLIILSKLRPKSDHDRRNITGTWDWTHSECLTNRFIIEEQGKPGESEKMSLHARPNNRGC